MKVLGGRTEGGIVVGNLYNKYCTKNPIARLLMNQFIDVIDYFVCETRPTQIFEVGCGEGFWSLRWLEQGYSVRACDYSKLAIKNAREDSASRGFSPDIFNVKSIYDLKGEDSADLVVCCEVLEHLESPENALKSLQLVTANKLLLSVPREPLWSFMNLARGKYIKRLGNTPGHIQRFSRSSFISIVSDYFNVRECKTPLPWTVLLCQP